MTDPMNTVELTTEADDEHVSAWLNKLADALSDADEATCYLSGMFLGIETGRMADDRGITVEQFMTDGRCDEQVHHPADREIDQIDASIFEARKAFDRMVELLKSRLL